MIIGRKDRERVASMETKIAVQNGELFQNEEIISYKSTLIKENEEEIARLKEIIRQKDECIGKLSRENKNYNENDKSYQWHSNRARAIFLQQSEKLTAAQNSVRLLNRIERDEPLETLFGDMSSI